MVLYIKDFMFNGLLHLETSSQMALLGCIRPYSNYFLAIFYFEPC